MAHFDTSVMAQTQFELYEKIGLVRAIEPDVTLVGQLFAVKTWQRRLASGRIRTDETTHLSVAATAP